MKRLILISAGLFLVAFARVAKAEDKAQVITNEFNNLVAKAMVEYMENEWIVVQGSKEYFDFVLAVHDKAISGLHYVGGGSSGTVDEESKAVLEAWGEIGKWFKFNFEVTGLKVKVDEINSLFGKYTGVVSGKGRSKKGNLYRTEEMAINSPSPDLSSVEFRDFELKYEYRNGKWEFIMFSSDDGKKYTAEEIRKKHCCTVLNGVIFDSWLPEEQH